MNKIRLLLSTASISTFVASGFLIQKQAIPALAEEYSVSEVVSEEAVSEISDTVSSDSEPKKEKSFSFEELKDVIVGLAGSASLMSFLGVVVAIITTITKIKKENSNAKLITDSSLRIEDVKAQILLWERNLNEFVELITERSNKVLDSANAALDSMIKMQDSVKEIIELTKSQIENVKNVEEMKETLNAMCSLIVKELSLSEIAVKSGIAEEANSLIKALNFKEEQADEQEIEN